VLQLLEPKCHALFADASLNTRAVVCASVHGMFQVAAAKFHAYACALPQSRRQPGGGSGSVGVGGAAASSLPFPAAFFGGLVLECCAFMYRLLRQRARSCGCRCDLSRRAVRFLGVHAFTRVLQRKSGRWRLVLAALTAEEGAALTGRRGGSRHSGSGGYRRLARSMRPAADRASKQLLAHMQF
jgi:hypothetical protein